MTCKYHNQLAQNNYLWYLLFCNRFIDHKKKKKYDEKIDWKEQYKKHSNGDWNMFKEVFLNKGQKKKKKKIL